jgi:RNA polymerase sigma-70 factor (ECF subfamily)
MDEPRLIQDAQSGDLDAFNCLVLAYQDLAFNLALRMLTDEDSADDAAQNAFISAYRNIKSFHGGSFRAWLLRIVTNQCYDELRRQKRHPNIPLEPVNDEDNEEIESPRWMASNDLSPEEQLERAELEHAVQHCLQNLPDDFRAVVILVDIQGMDYEEASQAVHKPLGTIKSRLARARLKMRDCLQKVQELLPGLLRLDSEEQE